MLLGTYMYMYIHSLHPENTSTPRITWKSTQRICETIIKYDFLHGSVSRVPQILGWNTLQGNDIWTYFSHETFCKYFSIKCLSPRVKVSQYVTMVCLTGNNPSETPYTRDCSHRAKNIQTNKNKVWIEIVYFVLFDRSDSRLLWDFALSNLVFYFFGQKSLRIWENYVCSSTKGSVNVFAHT